MSKYQLGYYDNGRCRIVHQFNNSEIVTDLPPEYGGSGRSFSSTDLVTAAVGSCYLSTIEEMLRRNDYNLDEVFLTVSKKLQEQPKKIKAISMQLHLPMQPSEKLSRQLDKAINLCPVKRSLSTDIEVTVATHINRQSL